MTAGRSWSEKVSGEFSALAAADICKYGDVSQTIAAVRVYVRRSRRAAWLSLADKVEEGQDLSKVQSSLIRFRLVLIKKLVEDKGGRPNPIYIVVHAAYLLLSHALSLTQLVLHI